MPELRFLPKVVAVMLAFAPYPENQLIERRLHGRGEECFYGRFQIEIRKRIRDRPNGNSALFPGRDGGAFAHHTRTGERLPVAIRIPSHSFHPNE